MIKCKLLIIILGLANIIFSQSIESLSSKTALRVKYGPPDHIPPIVHLQYPTKNLIDTLPIFTKDSVVNFSGDWSDNVGDVLYVTINDTINLSFSGKNYEFNFKLPYGLSTFNVSFEDFKKNSFKATYTVERNDTIDYKPPRIEMTLPKPKDRGIDITNIFPENNIISETEKFVIRGLVFEDSGIHAFSINDHEVSLDSNLVFNWYPEEIPEFIEIKAIDNFGNEAISSLSLVPEKEITQADLIVGNYHAIIIGVQNYIDKNIPTLDFPIQDTELLKNTLLEYYSFKESNIDLLVDPTRRAIIQKFTEMRQKLGKEDNLLVFYAGHGYWDEDVEQGYWLPSDASLDDDAEWLSNGRVRDYIRGINTKHTLLIADACFSGGIFKSREISLAAPKSIQEMYKSTSRRAMTSGTLKIVPDKSVFIKYLTKRLKENDKGFLTAAELFYSLKEAVINNSPVSQTPEYGVIHQSGDEGGGSFIFIKKKISND